MGADLGPLTDIGGGTVEERPLQGRVTGRK